MGNSSRTSTIATGTLLIVAPLIGLGLKLPSAGWMLVLLVLSGAILLLIAGFAVQIVIAAQGFLSKRALFGDGSPSRTRAMIAAWTTSIGAIATGILTPDGGDSSYGSTLQLWLGAYGPEAATVHRATDTLNDALFVVAATLWIGGFAWLFVEWVIALNRRRRERRASASM